MIRIWLNHWFSTAFNIINLIKENDDDLYVIGTNENKESPIKVVCDEWYQEPVLKGKEYVDFCLTFCKEHKIDVFMPRREMVTISKYKPLFTNIGVKVMVEDYIYTDLLNRKDKAYEFFKKEQIGLVPDYYVVNNIKDLRSSYLSLLQDYKQVCVKFVRDEGGKSFRLIDNRRKGYAALFKKQSTRMPYDSLIEALSEKDSFAPMMIMPYLPDDEISVDCLSTESGLIAIPRIKNPTRIEQVKYDDDIIETCEKIYKKLPLEHPCNIQFKYLDGKPYILEVNTRMSGGIQMACAVSKINIPNIAVNKLLGIKKTWCNNRIETSVTHVEIPIVL